MEGELVAKQGVKLYLKAISTHRIFSAHYNGVMAQ